MLGGKSSKVHYVVTPQFHSGFEVQNTDTVQSCRQTMSAIQNHKRQWEHWVRLWLAATVVEWKIIGSGQATNLQIHKHCKLKYNAEIVPAYQQQECRSEK